jgi:hypothetical protein
MCNLSIESTNPVSILIPASGFDCNSNYKSWTNSLASNPAFSAIVIGNVLKALAYDWIAIAYLPLIDLANFSHSMAIWIYEFPPP